MEVKCPQSHMNNCFVLEMEDTSLEVLVSQPLKSYPGQRSGKQHVKKKSWIQHLRYIAGESG